MKWYFDSAFGRMIIAPIKNGKFALLVDDEEVSRANSPIQLADNVYTHTSDCYDWDISDEEGPSDISEWSYLAL